MTLPLDAWHTVGVSAATPERVERGPIPIGSGRIGKRRAAVTRFVDSLGPLSADRAVTSELAVLTAALVDDYARQGDGGGMLKASKDLRELMYMLGTGGEVATVDSPGSGTIVELFAAPPAMGDASQS